ncbi:MAG TPA: aminoacyl-histidine dipeptidase [Deltaproteobacteria bacterium]|nr:aminoacyl-histidine dipeptidase [Deltaproteobacteria bacterium]HPR56306.1 aminoacyl-histidine dipeptidase [Deltaproteobacteria bacterium]HXK46470.1 aminoacyl-histidine dipeptidase [Deltaproteobacteria bacterium]
MKAIAGLNPQPLWRHFHKVSQIPRESGNEAGIAEHIRRLAGELGLACKTDDAGNIIARKPGTRGSSPVALQSHLDMVCEKETETTHDFGSDPIRLVRDGGWVRADGTTLGADNGIGVAAMLAVMEGRDLVHPDLELIFTVEEETGLTGAHMLSRGSFSATTLLNLDSEEEGTFIIGCAGGMDTRLDLELDFMTVPEETQAILVRVGGLQGGHSGTDIHRGLGNAIKLLARFLHATCPAYGFSLASIRGGSKHNAIPRDAEAVIHVDPSDIDALRQEAVHWNTILREELKHTDDGVALVLEELERPAPRVVEPEGASRILNLLQALPHGPLHFDQGLDNTVVTSTNLAVCSFDGDNFVVTTSQRSIIGSALHDMASQVASTGELAGCGVTHCHGYPAWRPSRSSPILNTCTSLFSDLTKREPKVNVIHAGLECAIIGEKIQDLDMISFGPTIERPHSPHERVNIESVESFWVFLTALLRRMAGRGE